MISAGQKRRWLADIGNSRMKWGRLDETGRFVSARTMELDKVAISTALQLEGIGPETEWAIASVNPPVAALFASILLEIGVDQVRLYESAEKVPIKTAIGEPAKAGADRALAVLAAQALSNQVGPSLVISCGTAITIERVNAAGIWEGGAIAPGLSLAAKSLHHATALLPWVPTLKEVPAWGDSTIPAVAAGVFWGTVGAVSELIRRQGISNWRYWTGGDAALISSVIEEPGGQFQVVPDLVLRGLAMTAYGALVEEIRP